MPPCAAGREHGSLEAGRRGGSTPADRPLPVRLPQRSATGSDIDALTDMTGLAAELDEAIAQAVLGLRKTGYSWGDIAARLGVSRQAAQQRWG